MILAAVPQVWRVRAIPPHVMFRTAVMDALHGFILTCIVTTHL